jgi:hypothetical protein
MGWITLAQEGVCLQAAVNMIGNELSDFTEGVEFLDQLSNCNFSRLLLSKVGSKAGNYRYVLQNNILCCCI